MKTILNFKIIKIIAILFLGLLLIPSCSDKEEPIGKWDDNIKLSTKNVELTSNTDSVTLTTEGDGWWIDAITFADSIYGYYGREDINLEADSYSIFEKDFLIEKRDKNTLFIKINGNNTRAERIMSITFEAGNYFDYVHITQAGN